MLEIIVIILIAFFLLWIIGGILNTTGSALKGFFEIGSWAVKKSLEKEERVMPRPRQDGERSVSEVLELKLY